MRFSEQWLREWVNPAVSTAELAEQLSMAGLEVTEIIPVAEPLENVIVSEVITVEKHPNADSLQVCSVDIAQSELATIVCGAANVRAGLKVAVALPGAKLPNGLKIKPTKLRGIESCGMICSETELSLASESIGIMELAADAPVGKSFFAYYKLADNSMTVELTPNRGDCLSIIGIAREVAAINKTCVENTEFVGNPAAISAEMAVDVSAAAECPHYSCRIIKGINPKAESPQWLREKLRRSGLNSISAVVDITNYVMLELGQPLHAFDLQKLNDKIEVRTAKPGEKLLLLNEKEYELEVGTLVIADSNKSVAMAGVMGGLGTAVTGDSCDILLESAFFTPEKLFGTARKYGLHTDSSHRFERGVDPNLQIVALERVTSLLLQIAGGEVGPITEVSAEQYLPSTPTIQLRYKSIARILGFELPKAEVETILQNLGMELSSQQDGWTVKVPSYRFDLHLEVDLLEEIARIHGYNKIPEHKPLTEVATVKLDFKAQQLGMIRSILQAKGYHEIVSYSFVDPELEKLLNGVVKPLILSNPIAAELAAMRTTIWPGLLKTMLYNQHRQQSSLRLFETGLCFQQTEEGITQLPYLGCLLSGAMMPEQWGESTRIVDFFDLKGDLESLLVATIGMEKIEFVNCSHPLFHPGQSAEIYCDKRVVGHIGALHPRLKAELDIKQDAYLFDLNLTYIYNYMVPVFKEISKFPQIRRDLALLIDETISARHLTDEIWKFANKILREVEIFDIYRGGKIVANKKSVAVRLVFQHPSRTLLDAEVEKTVAKITTNLQQQLGAVLRG